jgi:hypothetical protein
MEDEDEDDGFELMDTTLVESDEPLVPDQETTVSPWMLYEEYDRGGSIARKYNVDAMTTIIYTQDPDAFVRDMRIMCRRIGAHSFVLYATVYDLETHTRSENRPVMFLATEETFIMLAEYIKGMYAPGFDNGVSGSDSLEGLRVVFNMEQFRLDIARPFVEGVTALVGTSTSIPGYLTYVINPVDHGITYYSGECLFVVLNQWLEVRYDPDVVLRYVLGNKYVDRVTSTAKGLADPIITRVAEYYKCVIKQIDVNAKKNMKTSNNKQWPEVIIVKCGKLIGLLKSIWIEPVILHISNKVGHAFIDFETVSDPDNTWAYSMSCLWEDGTWFNVIHYNFEYVADSIRREFTSHLKNSECTIIYMHAWNGSRFDFRLMIQILANTGGLKLGWRVFNTAGDILTVDLSGEGKKIILRDPCKMYPATLAAAAKEFQLEISKLKVDHDAINDAYLNGTLPQYLYEHEEEITTYNRRDVQLLRDITLKIMAEYKASGLNYEGSVTMSSAAYQSWHRSLDEYQRKGIASISLASGTVLIAGHREVTIDEIKLDAIGGRTQCYSGEYENVCLVDVRGMYTHIARVNLFPGGDPIPVKEYKGENVIGIYEVLIIRQNHPHCQPYRAPGKPLDWVSDHPPFHRWITHVCVRDLIYNGADIEILGGMIFPQKMDYFSKFIGNVMKKRDTAKTPQEREHYKRIGNSLIGSTFQNLRRAYTQVFENNYDYIEYVKKYSKYVRVVLDYEYPNEQWLAYFYPIKLTDPVDVQVQKNIAAKGLLNKPILLNFFVYGYARSMMYTSYVYIEDNKLGRVVYMDTDSFGIKKTDKDNLVWHLTANNYIGSNPGQLEVERDNCKGVFVRSKMYALKGGTGPKVVDGVDKLKLKGIKRGSVCIVVDSFKEAEDIKNMLYIPGDVLSKDFKWYNNKALYELEMKSKKIDPDALPYTYENLVDVLRGKVLLNIDWRINKSKDKQGITKTYITKIFKKQNVQDSISELDDNDNIEQDDGDVE